MDVLAVANHKGGTGKSATAHALGAVLSGEGLRVLLVDMDPQGSLTQGCGLGDRQGRSMAEVLGTAQPGSLAMTDIIQSLGGGLAIAPADIALAACELGLVNRYGREAILKKVLATVANKHDLVIIDCPPSLGLLTVNALVASDAVLIPTQPQAVDLRGLRLFLNTLDTLRDELNPGVITGVVVTFYDARLNHHQAAIEAMQAADLPMMPVAIGRSVRVAEAAAAGQSVVTWEPTNPRAQEYRSLSLEVKRWLKNRT